MVKMNLNRSLIRNFLTFTILTLFCFGGLAFILMHTGARLRDARAALATSNETLIATSEIRWLVEGMIDAQRGYLLTADADFLKRYEDDKGAMSEQIAHLSELVRNSPSQQSRLDELRGYYSGLAFKLEERAQESKPNQARTPEALEDVRSIDDLRQDIIRLHRDIMAEEYAARDRNQILTGTLHGRYYATLWLGGLFCCVMMMMLNAFLLHAQDKRANAERFLKESEDRFAMAANGANDGIFDWNLDTGSVFYSRPFFAMLGYDRPSHVGHIDDFRNLIHPEDAENVWSYIDRYLRGMVSEYSAIFRMRHVTGRWVWINARAKAVYDDAGRPHRMVGAHTDITYLKEQQHRLEDAKHQAENASRAKTEFLAHMSHEIRTPLTAISGIAEIMDRQKERLDEKQRQLVATLLTSTSSLKDLVNDVLDFSKIESGEITLESKEFEISHLFQQVISITALNACEKGLKFMVDYDAVNGMTYRGDPLRIRQILINLIGNAIKFTDTGRVDVVVKRETGPAPSVDQIRVEVRDTGIGVSPAAMGLIFERFKQGDSSVSRKYGGTGLGLPISRNLARLMGGEITAQSEPGKGSCFTLVLPLEVMSLKTGEDKITALAPIAKTPPVDRSGAIDGKKRILVAEDYEGNIVVVGYFLEDMNLPFDIARSGQQALDQWERRHYDLILMDIQMPEMDGFTATRKIREAEARDNLPRTPIIGMTAHALVGDRDKCIEAGMDAYLSKPIVETDLRNLILDYLNRGDKAA
ncbi:MAG: response regulator [Alphaproteobacteria bacterium]|nr:response regulator [Alphaproteobacteria bacterium]USO08368.1 MAG: response regulator [Rhodospirillales bacterium]